MMLRTFVSKFADELVGNSIGAIHQVSARALLDWLPFICLCEITRCAGAFVACKIGTGLLDEIVRRNIDIT